MYIVNYSFSYEMIFFQTFVSYNPYWAKTSSHFTCDLTLHHLTTKHHIPNDHCSLSHLMDITQPHKCHVQQLLPEHSWVKASVRDSGCKYNIASVSFRSGEKVIHSRNILSICRWLLGSISRGRHLLVPLCADSSSIWQKQVSRCSCWQGLGH